MNTHWLTRAKCSSEWPENYEDLDEAHHACVNGLLVGSKADLDALRITGERLLQDALRPLVKLADSA